MRRLPWIIAAISVVGCARDVVGPRAGVTLLVTNASCLTGTCDSLRILAFPSDQPNTPGGLWALDVGMITTAQACFTLPPSAKFYIIGESYYAPPDTTTVSWTNRVPLSLGTQPPGGGFLQARPTTIGFIPANAAGWSITLPRDSVPTPSPSCTP